MFRQIARAARPWSLLAALLLYAIGGGIAAYLGERVDWGVLWSGLLIALLLLLSAYFLQEYFDRPAQPPFSAPPPPRPRPPANGGRQTEGAPPEDAPPVEVPVPRVIFLQIAATTLTAAAVLTVLLHGQGRLNPTAFFLIGLALLLALLYAVPPVRLAYTGYGELALAVMVANLFPSLAYGLLAGDVHRLLPMLTAPLTFLYLAAALARSLQGYLDDLKHERQTMLIRLGWQRGMALHNLLIASAYLLLAISVFFGLPLNLAFPALLGLPVGLYQIWQMNGIAGGAKPRWRILAVTAAATVVVTAYFINLALWTE